MCKHGRDNSKQINGWRLARSHPVLIFLAITFSWSWLIWLAAIPVSGQDKVLLMVITFIGGYGPALGGILTQTLKTGGTIDVLRTRLRVLAVAFVAIFMVMLLRYRAGNFLPGWDVFPENPTLTVPIVALGLLACLTGAWVISTARSEDASVRARMASLLPKRLPLYWLGFALFFFAALRLTSWGIGHLFGLKTLEPLLLEYSAPRAIYLLMLMFMMTSLIRGGMEEPGWRGFMLPELQLRFSPLVAALIIAVFWNVWHVPLHLNGFFPTGARQALIGRSHLILLSILFTWFYNRTGGNLFLMVCLHSSFNVVKALVPASPLPLSVLIVAFIVGVIFIDKMYKKVENFADPRQNYTAIHTSRPG